MRVIRGAMLMLGLVMTPAQAEPPTASPRPALRPAAVTSAQPVLSRVTVVGPVAGGLAASPRPLPRPREEVTRSLVSHVNVGLLQSPLPKKRSTALKVFASGSAIVAKPKVATGKSKTGSICGDPAILGSQMPRIVGRIKGCGVENPVRVTSVSGVKLSQAATINCDAAKALKKWVDKGLKPAVGKTGGGVSELRVVAHYACRTRNSKKGARISEHGKGNAIDIAGFTLANGQAVSVLKGYGSGKTGKILRKAHKAACGPFGTTLGPGSDGYHEDHLHFDVARYRSGPYCR